MGIIAPVNKFFVYLFSNGIRFLVKDTNIIKYLETKEEEKYNNYLQKIGANA